MTVKDAVPMSDRFAVLDTETTWTNELMSVGLVIASWDGFAILSAQYCILPEAAKKGGMFSPQLYRCPLSPSIAARGEALAYLQNRLTQYGVQDIFAYNAAFDHALLPELHPLHWFDIMRLAAYRQYNAGITADMPTCRSGRLKAGYGVEPMFRLLTQNRAYRETHNALQDALDELEIMKRLGHAISVYQQVASIL